MDIAAGSHGGQLSDYILDQLGRLRVIHVERANGLSAHVQLEIELGGVLQVWISGEDRFGMARKVDFRDDSDEALLSISDNLLVLLLGEETNGFTLVLTHAADLGQFGVTLDLNAPALVIGQVHVQHVEFIERQQVDHLFHLIDREKAATQVE